MNQSATTLMEIIFNIAYLVVVWTLVVLMFRRQPQLPAATRRLRQFFILAFGLLALGDTGHVGFRVIAYLNGGLEAAGNGQLVGLGALSTAITVTFFYVVMLLIWKERFGKVLGWIGMVLLAAAVVRLMVMVFPQNDWTSAVPPQPWSLVRNLPLMVQGFGVAYLILRDARAAQDRLFTSVGIMILVSYGFYLPVILFVQAVPPIGMLMIPKTLAYVAIAWLAFRALFQSPERVAARSQS